MGGGGRMEAGAREIRGQAPDVGGACGRRPTERDEMILKCKQLCDSNSFFISFTEIQLTKQVKIKAIEVMCSAGVCQSSPSIYLCQPLRENNFEILKIRNILPLATSLFFLAPMSSLAMDPRSFARVESCPGGLGWSCSPPGEAWRTSQ